MTDYHAAYPSGSSIWYMENWLNTQESAAIMQSLRNELPWQKEIVQIFGKTIAMNREVCFMGDSGIQYRYASKLKTANSWHPIVLILKQKIEFELGGNYNACLLNWYYNGEDGMGWHSDNEKEMIIGSTIASVSMGANRKFQWRPKGGGPINSLELQSGSLLLMRGSFQNEFKHALPKTRQSQDPRLNLTFRLFTK